MCHFSQIWEHGSAEPNIEMDLRTMAVVVRIWLLMIVFRHRERLRDLQVGGTASVVVSQAPERIRVAFAVSFPVVPLGVRILHRAVDKLVTCWTSLLAAIFD